MKKYLCILFFIILFPNGFSQSSYNTVVVTDSAEYAWKPKLDKLLFDSPSYFIASDLKLLSYKLLSNEEMKVNDFLRMPIDSTQLFPELRYSKKALEEMRNENFDVETYLHMVSFSSMSLKRQYAIIGHKVDIVSELIHKNKKASLIKLQWKYMDQEFFTYCVVSGTQFVYDYILSYVFVAQLSSKTEITIEE